MSQANPDQNNNLNNTDTTASDAADKAADVVVNNDTPGGDADAAATPGAAVQGGDAAAAVTTPDDMDVDTLRANLAGGVQQPNQPADKATPVATVEPNEGADDPDDTDTGNEPGADDAAAAAATTPDPDAPLTEEEIWNIALDEEDADTFRTDAEKFLEQVELPPAATQIIEHYRTAAATAEESARSFESLGARDTIERTMNAFTQMATRYVQDGDTGEYLPDTTAVIDLLKTDFPNEYRQMIVDVNSQPSQKYIGKTVFQEFIKDGFGLTPEAMDNLNFFLANNGNLPMPAFKPPGINQEVAEAYWKSVDREKIDQELKSLNEIIGDEIYQSQESRDKAKFDLQQLNARLALQQNGLDANRNAAKSLEDQKMQFVAGIQAKAEENYLETSVAMINDFSGKLAKSLTMFDDAGAEIAGLSFATLVEKALSDSDGYAKNAQMQLQAKGISFDWNKGREALDILWRAENKIVALEANKANTRAIEAAKQEKLDAVRSLQGLEKELLGKITKSVTGGANKALDRKIKDAPKIKAIRAKTTGAGAQNTIGNVAEMPLEDLRRNLSQTQT